MSIHARLPFFLSSTVCLSGEKIKPTKTDDDHEEGKSEDSERDGDSDKEESKRKRKRDDGPKDDTKRNEKLSTPSGSSTSSQGTNGSTSPELKRRLIESPLTSNAEVFQLTIFCLTPCAISVGSYKNQCEVA